MPKLRQLVTKVCRGPCLIPGQTMWDLVWTKWQWNRFFFENSNPSAHIILTNIVAYVPDVPSDPIH